MTPPVRPFFVFLLAALFAPPARAEDKPAPKPTGVARRDVLLKAGYTAVPLTLDPTDLYFYADGTVGGEKAKFWLDSGQNATVLDGKLAKRLKLEPGEEHRVAGVDAVWTGREVAIPGLALGPLDTRADLPLGLNGLAADGLRLGGNTRADVLVGSALLDAYGAVVDYPARTLYVRPPLTAAWPKLAGAWTVTSRREDDAEVKLDPARLRGVEFVGRRARVTVGDRTEEHAVQLYPQGGNTYLVLMLDPKAPAKPVAGPAERPEVEDAWLVKLAGGTMTACVVVDSDKAKGPPEEFAAPKGSGYALLELKRAGPAPADTAPADPLRDLLVKGGFTAVPLDRDVQGHRRAAGRVGDHALTLLVDTGANLSWYDAAGLKKWGATRGRAVEGDGLRDKVRGDEFHLRGLKIGGYDTGRAWRGVFGGGGDLSGMNAVLAEMKRTPLDGLVGAFDLMNGSAVIDYHTDTLYLRPIKEAVWPQLAGRWEGVAWQQGGREGRYAPGAAAVEFKDGRLRFAANGKTAEWGFHLRDDGAGYRVGLFDPAADVLAADFEYGGRGLLVLDGDTLGLLMERGRDKIGENPTEGIEFGSPPGSERLLVEYRRAK